MKCVGGICRAGDMAGRGHGNGTQSKPWWEPGGAERGEPGGGTLQGRSLEPPGASPHPGAASARSYRRDQEFKLCCCREPAWQEPRQESGGLWPSRRKNPGEREDGENHRQVRCLAKAAAPCPTAKVCKGQGKSRAGSPQQPFTCSFSISGEATWPRRESSGASWHEQKISPEAVGWGRETPRLLQSFAVFCSAEPCSWASQQRAKSCAPSADRSGAGTGTRCRHGSAALSTR